MDLLDIAIVKQLTGGGGGSGTDNYNDLSNLPMINDTTLSGNKTSANLGLQSEINSDSKLASDLVDDTNQDNKFVTSSEKSTWNGKQNAIDADHKINADYVDDSTSTNKFVTATDKETWNAKQNAIDSSHKLSSDLVDDTNHTNKFVTSTEKQTWNGKQNAIDSDHKLSSSLVSFTTAEAAALASGIDSTKVGQISTNQTNILYVADSIGKNQLDTSLDALKAVNTGGTWNGNVCTYSVGTVTVNADGTITVKKTSTTSRLLFYLSSDDADLAFSGTKLAGYILSGCPPTGSNNTYGINGEQTASPWGSIGIDFGNGYKLVTSSIPVYFYISLKDSYTTPADGLTFKPMICTEEAWNISHEFEQYALPNYDLTRLEAEDRASLAEVVDSGAKNLWANGTSGTISGWRETFQIGQTLKKGTYIISFDSLTSTDTDANTCQIIALNGTTQVSNFAQCPRGNKVYTILEISADANVLWIYSSNASGTGDGDTATFTNGMICTKAAFGVSNKFVPYRPNYDLVAKAVNAQNLYGEFAASTSITFESSLALVTIKRNDSNADNVAVYVVANLRDGLTYKPIISSENIPVTIARDSNNSKNVKITNNGNVYYFYLISRYPSANL